MEIQDWLSQLEESIRLKLVSELKIGKVLKIVKDALSDTEYRGFMQEVPLSEKQGEAFMQYFETLSQLDLDLLNEMDPGFVYKLLNSTKLTGEEKKVVLKCGEVRGVSLAGSITSATAVDVDKLIRRIRKLEKQKDEYELRFEEAKKQIVRLQGRIRDVKSSGDLEQVKELKEELEKVRKEKDTLVALGQKNKQSERLVRKVASDLEKCRGKLRHFVVLAPNITEAHTRLLEEEIKLLQDSLDDFESRIRERAKIAVLAEVKK